MRLQHARIKPLPHNGLPAVSAEQSHHDSWGCVTHDD